MPHPLGFVWEIDSRESLWTYLTSCEKYTTKLIQMNSPRLNTFICIGANRGWYPLLVGLGNKQVRIFAFEPNTTTFEILERNVNSNDNQTELYKGALGEREGSANLFTYPASNDGMCTLYPTTQIGENPTVLEEVSVESLDHFLEGRFEELGSALILIDVEGGEMGVLSGAIKTLTRHRPTVICEVNPILIGASGSSYKELFQFMERLNYVAYWIDERQSLKKLEILDKLPHLDVLPVGSGANYLFIQPDEVGSWELFGRAKA
ncbi:MAG: FkbM family methyltransferase [Candidatus Nanopelagicaceae bacterium]|nr:FkbM family methyltransferase [Candidatus Nanopelagicaceae bacterium]